MPKAAQSKIRADHQRWFRLIDLFIQVLIVVSLFAFCVETVPNLSDATIRLLERVEVFTVVVFTIEYAVRLIWSKHKLKFVFSFFGLIDLMSILPFYIASGIDLRSVRAFRLLRLFRLLKLARYHSAIRRFHRAFVIAWEEIVLFVAATMVMLFVSAVGIYHFEHEAQPEAFASVFHSLWWSVTTLTTVGYGDIYPITLGGRIFTFITLLVGLGIVAVPAGLISSALAKAREIETNDALVDVADACATDSDEIVA